MQGSVGTLDLLQGLGRTHSKLAGNGENTIVLRINGPFPETLNLHRVIFKRIINNFITNSLKHTTHGKVGITFNIEKYIRDFNNPGSNYYHIGRFPECEKQ